MISISDFHSGLTILLDGQPWSIVEHQHVKPGKGGAFMRTKLRRLRDGSVVERTFRPGEKFKDAYIEKRTLQYLYRTTDTFHLMDTKSFDAVEISAAKMGKAAEFIKENTELEGQFFEGELIRLDPPTFVEIRVKETPKGVRGDTSKAAMKPATLETGVTVQVPLFIDTGDTVRVDTRTGSYVSRA